jgi:hypothetical protein
MENYGDIHLHQSDYPNDPTAFEGTCRYNALNYQPYDEYVAPQPEKPLGMNRCHVEYCHPGSWSSRCGQVKEYSAANDTDSCNHGNKGGVFGDEPVGNYDNYIPEKHGGFVAQPSHSDQAQAAEAEMVNAQIQADIEGEQYWTAYRILLWLFVLAVGFILLRRIARR